MAEKTETAEKKSANKKMENIKSKTESKNSKTLNPQEETKAVAEVTESKTESVAEKKNEPAVESKPAKPEKKQEISKKEEAVARGTNLPASKKHCMYICSYIMNKPIDWAINELQDVIKMKKPIPMKGEIPHRSHPGMMSGRYPVNASKQFIYLLKALKGNAIVNGLDISKTRICFASATWASRPARRGGTRFKRSFVLLKAKEFNNKKEKKE